MDVETTLLAACRRLLTDSRPAGSSAALGGGVSAGGGWLGGLGDAFAGGLAAAGLSSAGGGGDGNLGEGGAQAPSAAAVLAARGEALLRLAEVYGNAKSSNPDAYTWREAFAQAAAGASR